MKNHIANVLDLELSCYPSGIFPADERQEIIEFGLTTIDLRTMRIIKTVSLPVVPTMSSISPFCTELTGWTEAALRKQGVSFAQAVRWLTEKNGSRNRLLVTDSAGDRRAVEMQCAIAGVMAPFGDHELNVSVLYSMVTGDFRNVKLEEKLRRVGLAFEGRPHRADNDSRNIARLLAALTSQLPNHKSI